MFQSRLVGNFGAAFVALGLVAGCTAPTRSDLGGNSETGGDAGTDGGIVIRPDAGPDSGFDAGPVNNQDGGGTPDSGQESDAGTIPDAGFMDAGPNGQAPGAPASVEAIGGNAMASVIWDPPAHTGSSAISRYTVVAIPGGQTVATNGATNAVVSGLTNGTTYSFEVSATNAAGTGPWSALSNSVTPATVPNPPTNVIATAGNGEVTVTWVSPVNNGGDTVSGYTVTEEPGGSAMTVVSTGGVFAGLLNGTTYRFSVVANNAIGSSVAAESNAATTEAADAGHDAGPTDAGHDAGFGSLGCEQVVQCEDACPSGDAACDEDCISEGTPTAQSLINAANTCLAEACPATGTCSVPSSSGCQTCLQDAESTGACAADISACLDNTSVDAGPADAGHADGGHKDAGPVDAGDLSAYYCLPCTTDMDCGAIDEANGTTNNGNYCLCTDSTCETTFCGTACTTAAECEASATCVQIGENLSDGGFLPIGDDCVPTSGVCPAAPVDAGPPDAGPKDAGPVDAGNASAYYCLACTTDMDCGAIDETNGTTNNGNYCLCTDSTCTTTFCGTACTSAAECEASATCVQIGENLSDGGFLPIGEDCVPTSGTCPATTVDAGPADAGHKDAGSALVTVPLTGCPFLGFDAPVKIDSQSFELDVDTGSTTTFVAASTCSNCDVTPEWNPALGGVATGSTADSTYGSGSVIGLEYTDKVQVGTEMPVVTMNFGAITSQTKFFLGESCTGTGTQQGEGIIGMGPIDLSVLGAVSSDAYFTDLVASGMGIADVFSVNLCSQNGNIWFGGYDTAVATGAVTYTPMIAMSSSQPYWEVAISSVGIGSTTIANSGVAEAVVNTGTGIFLMPAKAYTGVVKELTTDTGVTSIFGSGALDAAFFSGGNCISPLSTSTTQADVDAALPPLTMTLPDSAGGTFTLSMPASQSYLAILEGQYCGAIESNSASGGLTIWGAPALRAYVTVFDETNTRIGFAEQTACK